MRLNFELKSAADQEFTCRPRIRPRLLLWFRRSPALLTHPTHAIKFLPVVMSFFSMLCFCFCFAFIQTLERIVFLHRRRAARARWKVSTTNALTITTSPACLFMLFPWFFVILFRKWESDRHASHLPAWLARFFGEILRKTMPWSET